MTVRELQNELLELKRSSASNTVAAALLSLQQELAKPPPGFDPYRALAGLKSLVDLARDKADARTKRFSTVPPSPRQSALPKHYSQVGWG